MSADAHVTPPRPKPAIASMAEPSLEDVETTIVTATYEARERLSFAEREASDGAANAVYIQDAYHLLLCAATLANSPALAKARSLLVTAASAAKVAGAHGSLVIDRAAAGLRADPRLAELHARSLTHFARATESARSDAHRALAELAERLPNAYEKLDD